MVFAVLRPGDQAPDFPLKDASTLHELLQKSAVVLYFFPKAFTPG
jgi:peroxiredoxin